MTTPIHDDAACQGCGAHAASVFHEVERVPIHCCRLIPSREEALRAPVGSLRLLFCTRCGLIQNSAFESERIDYRADYEDDQAFSPLFREFATSVAQRLIDDYDLHGKDILEIGGGSGFFLTLLSELGANRGTGIDPAHRPERRARASSAEIRFIEDFYSAAHRGIPADLIACRHTLEHLPDVKRFVQTIRESIEEGRDPVVFFEVPDVVRVLDDFAFWDFYYEHCSYFSCGSLARLFRSCGFEILRLTKEFDEQYILLDTRRGAPTPGRTLPEEEDLDRLAHSVQRFRERVPTMIDRWRERLADLRSDHRRVVLWGAGSKAVGFLTALGQGHGDEIEYVVDINPRKEGMYLAGTGQKIVAPESLRAHSPDLVIIMNPIYLDEVSLGLRDMGLSPEVMAL